MWTSSYLPRTRTLVRGGLLLGGALGLLGIGLHVRDGRCHLGDPPVAVAPAEPAAARLRIEGTPGACVRIDGQVVGPMPAEVALSVSGPRRLVVQACKRGHLDSATEVELRPGEERVAHVYLPRYQLLRGGAAAMPLYAPRPSRRCPCQE